MACNCAQPSCNTCTPCCPPNPCAPCGVNGCAPSPAIPCPEDCEIPIYTSSQCTYQTVKCVTWEGLPNACVGIESGNNLEDVIKDVINYTKTTLGRLTAQDESILITPIDDACDDKTRISVNRSEDGNNVLELRPNGLFVPASTTNIATTATQSINLDGSGASGNPLTASLIQDPASDNILEIGPDGVYVPATVPLGHLDTPSVDLNITANVLTANVKLDPSNTNIIGLTPSGLLAEDQHIRDIEAGLTQHFIFNVAPFRELTYITDEPPSAKNTLRVVLGRGDSYATDYSLNNPNVKVFWDDNAVIENSLTNAGTSPNQTLEHTYPGPSDFYRQGYVKGYNGDHLTSLSSASSFGSVIDGFKFIKGGQHITSITLGGYTTGTEGVFDFKGLFNLGDFYYGIGGETTYKGVAPKQSYENMGDLVSLNSWTSFGNVSRNTDFILVSPTLNNVFLNFVKPLRHLQMKNKTNLVVQLNACGVDTVNMEDSTLSTLSLANCGDYFYGFINKLIFKLNQSLYEDLGIPTWVQGSGIFDLAICRAFTINNINGVFDETTRTITPTKILFPDFTTDGKLRYIDANQNFIKAEAIHSLNNNGLLNGSMYLTGNAQVHSLGLDYLHNYYNPTYHPLLGSATVFKITVNNNAGPGPITGFEIGGIGTGLENGGHRYNSIPVFTKVAGPGTGFTYEVVMQLGSSNAISGGINTPGTGYAVNDLIPLGTLGPNVLQLPVLRVLGIDGSGGVTNFDIPTVLGEFKNTLPATLPHVSGGTGVGINFVLDTTHRWNVRRGIILSAGIDYNSATSVFKSEVSTFNGTGSGTATVAVKAAIDGLHNKGWNLRW